MIKLAIFDFDGTIADTATDIVNAAQELFQRHNRPPVDPQIITDHIGLGLNQLIEDVFPEFSTDEQLAETIYNDFVSIYQKHYLKTPKIYPGLEAFLQKWPHKIAIVSNKLEGFLRPTVEHLGLDKYNWVEVLGRDSMAECKPHAMPLLKCCETAGVTPAETVMVGDGLPDVGSALNAQIQCIAVDFGYSPTHHLMEAGAHHLIHSYDELPQVIEKIDG